MRTRKSVYQEACAILYAKIQIGIRVPTLFEAEIFVEDKWFEIKKPETLVLPQDIFARLRTFEYQPPLDARKYAFYTFQSPSQIEDEEVDTPNLVRLVYEHFSQPA